MGRDVGIPGLPDRGPRRFALTARDGRQHDVGKQDADVEGGVADVGDLRVEQHGAALRQQDVPRLGVCVDECAVGLEIARMGGVDPFAQAKEQQAPQQTPMAQGVRAGLMGNVG